MKYRPLLSSAASLLLLTAVHGVAQADRLLPSDLQYLGAFMVPATNNYAGMAAIDSPSSISYRPDGNPNGGSGTLPGSLFLSNRNIVTEITIPAPVKSSVFSSLNTAKEIQASQDITGSASLGPDDRFGAIAYVPAKGSQTAPSLYWSAFEYYNVAGDDYNSIGQATVNLSAPGSKGLWHVGPPAGTNLDSAYHGQKYGDYLIPIDQAWADKYTGGKSLLTGRYREAGAAGGSMGPVLAAIGPWQTPTLAAGGALGAVPLMYFNTITDHTADTTWMQWTITGDPNYIYYSAGDRWHGGAWVARGTKLGLLIVGRHGTYNGVNPCAQTAYGDGCHGAIGTTTPPYCYGVGGTDCPSPIAVTSDKGYHNGPYLPRLLFIDPNDLAAVAQGTKSPSSVSAYTEYDPTKDWPWHDTDGFNDVAGAAYDSVNGYLYIVEGNGYRPGGGSSTPWPVIHVYKVNGTVPSPPSNVTVQ